jgi:ComF family protein
VTRIAGTTDLSQPRDGARARRLTSWLSPYVDLIFPPSCDFCHGVLASSGEGLLCSACREELADPRAACARCGSIIVEHADSVSDCPQCRDRRFHFDAVVRLGAYEGFRRSAVLRIKRPSQRNLAASLADVLATAEWERLRAMTLDGIVPVPMHWTRRIWRGVNSPETIAECFARTLGLPLAPHLLSRRRRTAPQASLAPSKRRANVRGAFRAASHPELPGARLLLVDDIMTTGATVNEAAKVLRRAGASFVAVAVVARAEGMA